MSTLKTNNIQHVDRSDPSILINTDGSVSIAGTVTYEDVTSVDSVGIVTARTGIDIIAGDLVIPESIVHRGDTDTKIRFSQNDRIQFEVNGSSAMHVGASGNVNIDNQLRISDSIARSDDLDTKIRFPAADTFSVETAGNERARINSSGKVLIGSDTIRNIGGAAASPHIQLEGTTANTSSLALINNQANTNSPVLSFGKTRGTSTGAVTTVADGDNLGSIKFCGADGTDIENSTANILAIVNGTVSGNQIPTDLVFQTSSTGSSGRSDRLRITSTGSVGIVTDSPTAKLSIGNVTGDYLNADGIQVNRPHSLGLKNGVIVYSDAGYNPTASYHAAAFKAVGTTGAALGISTDAGSNGLGGTLNARVTFDGGGYFLGNVGFGTASPIAKLNVNSGTTDLAAQLVSTDANVFLAFKDGDSTGNQQVQIGGVGNDFVAYAGGNERFRIDSNGVKVIKNGNLNINSAYIDFSGSVSTPSTAAAIYRPADNQLAFSTGNNERLRIVGTSATNGRILIGRTSSSQGVGLHPRLQIQSTTTNDYGRMELAYSQGNVTGPGIYFTKTRGSTADAVTSVNSGDQIGALFFLAADGTDRANRVAEIQVKTEGTIGNNATPGRLIFSTTPAGSNTCLDRLTINSSGIVQLSTTNNSYIRGGIYAKYTGASGSTSNINNSSITKVSWLQTNTEIFENGGFTNTATDVTVPKTGIYMITFNGYLNGSNIRTNVRFRFRINGTDQNTDLSLNNYIRRDSSHNESSVNFSAYYSLSAGDTVAVSSQQIAAAGTVVLEKNLSSLTFHLVA